MSVRVRLPETQLDLDCRDLKPGDKVSVTVTFQTVVSAISKDRRVTYLKAREGEKPDVVHLFTMREGGST